MGEAKIRALHGRPGKPVATKPVAVTIWLDDAELERYRAIAESVRKEAVAAGRHPPTLADVCRLLCREGLKAVIREGQHPVAEAPPERRLIVTPAEAARR